MGATTFITYSPGEHMKTAYQEACSEATRCHGNDGYNGTISTTSGVQQEVTTSIMTRSGAELYAYLNSEKGEKWGNALAIPVADNRSFSFEDVTMKISLPTTQGVLDWDGRPVKQRPTNEADLQLAAREKALGQYGAKLHDIEVEARIKYDYNVWSPEGRATTVYVVNGSDRQHLTKASAVKAAKELMKRSPWGGDAVQIKAIKVWDGNSSAVVVNRVTLTAEATATVTVAKRQKDTPDGWIFFGWAAM